MKTKQKGFTILELIIAIFVVSLAFGAVYGLISASVGAIPLARERLIAAYLAQEGIEITRNIRDSNWLAGRDWLTGLEEGGWEADFNDPSLSPSTLQGRPLKISNTGFYNYEAGSTTSFKRKITITPKTDADGKAMAGVVALVSWQVKGKNYGLSAQENLYNWKP